MSETNRRKFIGRGVAAAAAVTAAASTANAQEKTTKRVIYRNGKKPATPPRYSETVAYGNLIFISGVGVPPARRYQGPHGARSGFH